LRVEAAIARSGVLPSSNGTREWKEYRPPGEAFKADSMATAKGGPVTDLHPPKVSAQAASTMHASLDSLQATAGFNAPVCHPPAHAAVVRRGARDVVEGIGLPPSPIQAHRSFSAPEEKCEHGEYGVQHLANMGPMAGRRDKEIGLIVLR
jgi:hypothetical protein